MTTQYKQGNAAAPNKSTMGYQTQDFLFYRKALVDLQDERFFMPLADVRAMPKNYGKTIKQYHYIPLLDDRNINDQGIDASGDPILLTTMSVTLTSLSKSFAVEDDATAAVGAINAIAGSTVAVKTGTVTPWAVTVSTGVLGDATDVQIAALELAWGSDFTTVNGSGNLYGSSKDIGTIVSKFPSLSETGGRKNRVGYTRRTVEGSIEMLGFFDEFTRESMDFDSDAQLEEHLSRESIRGAIKISEAALQIDLLNGAGLVKYSGPATKDSEISGETADLTVVTYNDLVRLSIDLDNAKAPKSTKIITGSRMVDTRVVGNARYLYCGSEMLTTLMRMEDFHKKPAFISVEHYADAGTIINGEAGTVAGFRVIVVPEMLHWAGEGASVTTAGGNGYRNTAGKYDIFPMLFVGSGSFTTIGFQTTEQGGVKFEIIIKKPGKEQANTLDPFGELGFHSIRWYYGTMILRPEWLAVQKTVAPL